ncbi:prephenate dehydrogenase [Corticicoccus populi]|uniref:Prephenate dehydrogenase n=1 Tax=Corticicoccus populi TaxID=1812821 RepID=A0ABW5WY80_9STAP
MKIVIVGLGNIGGSFALAIKESGLNHEVYAIDKDIETLRTAEEQNLIIQGFESPSEIIPKADFIIFSVYPLILEDVVRSYIPYLSDGTIITDVTGVKRNIIGSIEPLLPENVDFIFSHPMAGRENSGLAFASAKVFQGANYLITPTPRNKTENVQFLSQFVKDIGFRNISEITPEFHDEIIGFTSQLTHTIAISLINSDLVERNTKQYTGDSYRDLTRIANINEKLWPELFIMNKDYLVEHIDNFKHQLDKLSTAIKDEDVKTMEEMMVESKVRYHDLHSLDMKE